MRLDKDSLINDLLVLEKNFYKVIEINLKEDTYFEVKVNEDAPVYKSVKKWIEAFLKNGGVHPDDIYRFCAFFARMDGKPQRVYYRRLIDNGMRWVCMECWPTENFDEDDPIVIVVVRDVEDYIRDYHEQVGYDIPEAEKKL